MDTDTEDNYMRLSKLKSLFLLMFMSVALMLTACDDMPDSADSLSTFDADGVVDAWDEITSRDELEHVSTDDGSQATSENRIEADTTSKPTEATTTVKETEADTTVKQTEAETTVKQTEAETTTKYVEPDTTMAASRLVWISATGSKYHSKNDCGNMNPKKARQMTVEEAQEQGYEPCKKCY